MTLKERILNMQLEGLSETNMNGLNGRPVARALIENRNLWSMVYFGDMELLVAPADGHDDQLFALLSEFGSDELDWEELDGKRFVRAWWD